MGGRIVLVDMDGVLADFEAGLADGLRARFPAVPVIDPSERVTFYARDQYAAEHADAVTAVYTAPGFFHSLPPVEGAVEAMHAMADHGLDVRICTSPLFRWQDCVAEKYAWVEQHLGDEWIRRIILTKDKTYVIGDVLVDDRPDAHHGRLEPSWQHVIFHAPCNQDAAGPRLGSWGEWPDVLLPLLAAD